MNRRFRHIAILALAAVMTVGCGSASEEDIDLPVPPQPGQETPIAFSGSLSEEGVVTRSEPAGLETVLPNGDKKFVVWAFKNDASNGRQTVMNGYTVCWVDNTAYTTTSNTHDWEYVNQQTGSNPEQTIKYWDWGASAYRFFGYTGSVNVTPPGSTASDPLVLSFTAEAAATNPQLEPVTLPDGPFYSKMWYSTGNPDVYPDRLYGKPVLLEFLKPYVKVRFLFKQSAPEDMVFDLTDKSFKPTDPEKIIATSGTFTVTYPMTGATEESWSVTDGTTTLTDVGVFVGFTVDNLWYVVLPAHGTGTDGQGSYTLSVSVNGELRTVVVPAQYMEWCPGYEYTYIFKITDAGGVALDNVEVGFSSWTTIEVNRDIYNW